MKLYWFVPSLTSLISVLCLIAPAQAGELTTWQFNANQNRLEFNTDEDVQPRAQLVFDPTRLVIDLPGIRLSEALQASQLLGGAIQQVRIGQFDADTARIVVELAPGYTLDPQQIQFRGLSPTQWMVQLPQPQLSNPQLSNATLPETAQPTTAQPTTAATLPYQANSPVQPTTASPASSLSANRSTLQSPTQLQAQAPVRSPAQSTLPQPRSQTQTPAQPRSQSRMASSVSSSEPQITQVESVRVTSQGLLVSTEGAEPKVTIERSRNQRSITVRIENAQLASRSLARERQIDRHRVDELEIDQADNGVEIRLDVERRGPDWQAEVNRRGEILLLPDTQIAEKAADPVPPSSTSRSQTAQTQTNRSQTAPVTVAEQPSPARLAAPANSAPSSQLATVSGIDLDISGSQLLIQTDRPVAHSARWQGGMYVVTLSPARLASRVSGPQLSSTDPLRRVRLRQVDDQTVAISIQPATGIQFGSLNLVTPQMLALEMQRAPARTAASTSSGQVSGQVSGQPLPGIIPNGQLVVVIDPGHGGADPGAVGISNLHEADVVWSISQQLASLLQQQGIQVIMTRNGDEEVDLEPRVQIAEQARATLFVSIHANSMGMDRPDINGTETYYYSSGEALAQTIQNSIVNAVGTNDRGIRQARFYVLRRTSMPAVLVETGYVTGSEDSPRLANRGFQTQMAWAIARGILQYLQQALTGSR